MRPRLIILDESAVPRQVLPEGKALEIGRAPNLGIVLADRTVSRRHAVLRMRGSELLLEDLGSTFGTYVNERPLGAEQAVVLQDGDLVRLGHVHMVCRLESEEGDVESATREAAFAAQANARVLVHDGETVRRLAIAGPVTRIGAGRHCDVCLLERTAAPEAAAIRAGEGGFRLEPGPGRTALRLNEDQALVGRPVDLPSGSVILAGRSQILFLYDFGPGGRRVSDPLAGVPRRRLLSHVAEQTGIAMARLKGLVKPLPGAPGQHLGEVLVKQGLLTPLFWRVVCARHPQPSPADRWVRWLCSRTR